MTDAPEFLLFVIPEKLSDGSVAHNVHFGEMKFAATSEDDAIDLAEGIAELINQHTVNTAGVVTSNAMTPTPATMTTDAILERIAALQEVQGTNHPKSKLWNDASKELQPLFAEMARRRPTGAA
jgi:hypothetical protein